jgi:hypothetical protein
MTSDRYWSLLAGVAVAALGLVLLLFEDGSIEMHGGWLAAIIAALAGLALVSSGLGAREP